MATSLPPLNALRAFEAAGRHLSFARAAAELGVTPAAVSHQIKGLEDWCGAPLFTRLTRALALTETGREALPDVIEGFERLAAGAARLRAEERGQVLTVSVAPSFGAKWLMPRLERFRAACPEFDLRIDATDDIADFRADRVDVALRYGGGRYPGLHVELVMDEVAFPVCAPALRDGAPPLRRPADLAGHTLLHVQWKMEVDSTPTWRMWLRAAGIGEVDAGRGPRFNLDSLAVQAAIDGQGVALANGALVADDLAAGRLVRPFPPSAHEATAFSYFLVCPRANLRLAKVRAFRDWIRAEAAAP